MNIKTLIEQINIIQRLFLCGNKDEILLLHNGFTTAKRQEWHMKCYCTSANGTNVITLLSHECGKAWSGLYQICLTFIFTRRARVRLQRESDKGQKRRVGRGREESGDETKGQEEWGREEGRWYFLMYLVKHQ